VDRASRNPRFDRGSRRWTSLSPWKGGDNARHLIAEARLLPHARERHDIPRRVTASRDCRPGRHRRCHYSNRCRLTFPPCLVFPSGDRVSHLIFIPIVQLHWSEIEGQLVDCTVERKRHLVVLLIHRGAGVDADVEGLTSRH
jgi:hypothetical protein